MQNSKLIDLLKTFDKEDWRWFRKFLLSPYFNSREELVPFFDYLRKQAPDFNEKAIRKEKVFKKVFPKQNYNEKQISYTMNFMLGHAERFLAQREIEKKTPLINNSLLKSYVDRNLSKHYNYQYDKNLKSLKVWKAEDIDFHLFEFQFSKIANDQFLSQKSRKYDKHLQRINDSLDQFYILNKIKYSCEMLSRSTFLDNAYQSPPEEEILKLVNNDKLINSPIISIYLEIFRLLKKDDSDSSYEILKTYLEEYKAKIPKSENQNIYFFCINFCIGQMRKNNKIRYYAEECLNYYLIGVDEGYLLNKKGFLTHFTFKNVIRLGLNLKKYDFTEEFVQKYHKKLEKDYQEDALHFNLADINYRKKNYQEAQIYLIQVQYLDIFYNLDAKAMLLKIYFETDEGEALFALIASFSIYLRRNKKIAKDVREAYLNFTNILGRIVRATKDKYPSIVDKINITKHLYNRNWLLEICKGK